MRRRLTEGPADLRQAYMTLLLESVTVDHVRLAGSPAVLENLASRGASKSSPEVSSFVREWRAGVGKGETWIDTLTLGGK
jgi:hypothetical protein